MDDSKCVECGVAMATRFQKKYCSNKCQSECQYKKFIGEWKRRMGDGGSGPLTKNISKYLKRYILEKYDRRCTQCGWNKVNPKTGRSSLEVDHIDGNSYNNIEGNLRLLCPNCHSLTPTFKNLNRGKGRHCRRKAVE